MQFLTPPASISSSASTPVPVPPARLLGVSRCLHALPSRPTPQRPRFLRARRSVLVTPRAHGCRHGHGHHHRHGHCHGHRGRVVEDNNDAGGAGVGGEARAVGLASVADALREHLHVCCVVALGLLLVAAACPLVVTLGSGASRLVQAALVAVACALVGVTLTQPCSFVNEFRQLMNASKKE